MPWHDELGSRMLAIYDRFWWHVQNRVPPEVQDGKAETLKALLAVRGSPQPSVKMLFEAEAAQVEEYCILEEELDRKQARLSLLKNRVVQSIGDYQGAATPSGCRVKLRKHGVGFRLTADNKQKVSG